MANRKLNSIKFPDIADTYILDADKVNFDDSETYASGSVGKALQNKANIDGSYEDLTAGTANQINTSVRANDKTPYIFRTSGGSVDIGDREYVNGIVGGTVAWNQQIYDGNFSSANAWNALSGATKTISNNEATIEIATAFGGIQTSVSGVSENNLPTLISGHKYFISADIKASNNRTHSVGFGLSNYASGNQVRKTFSVGTSYANYAFIGTASATTAQADVRFMLYDTDGASSNTTLYAKNCMCFDLTQMFGSTIADYIYSLETATAGAGVAWFKKLFNKPYYAYNAGELKSVSGLVSHDMTGFNQFDKSTATVYTAYLQAPANNWAYNADSKSMAIRCLPNTEYCAYVNGTAPAILRLGAIETDELVVPTNNNPTPLEKAFSNISDGKTLYTTGSNAKWLIVQISASGFDTFKENLCINISWDGSRNGEYEEYELHSYPLDSDLTLRGIPKLDADNKLYYDGDTYESDGTVTRKYGVLDLGSVTWTKNTAYSNNPYFAYELSDTINSSQTGVCSKYTLTTFSNLVTDNGDKQFALAASSNKVYVKDTAYTEADAFKTAMSGVYLVYELATPTTETADAYQQTEIVSDFGTEEFVIDDDVFAIPVGHNTDYPVNLVAKLEMAPNSPDGDGDYIVRQTNGINSYVPLIIEDALPTIPSETGTYKLTVTVTEGSDPVLSWTAE